MTNGSCHSTCESNVHTWLKPAASAFLASSTTSRAGGSFCRTTPMSILWFLLWGFPPRVNSRLSEQIVGEAALDVPASAGAPGVLAAGRDHLAAGHHRVDL